MFNILRIALNGPLARNVPQSCGFSELDSFIDFLAVTTGPDIAYTKLCMLQL